MTRFHLAGKRRFVSVFVLALASLLALSIKPAYAAAIMLSPNSGPVGTSVTVTGSGFAGSRSITITFDGGIVIQAACTTNFVGTINSGCAFTVPTSSSDPHTVLVSDGSTSASAFFTVTGPTSIMLSPMSGLVGTVVTVSGSGFKASVSLTLTYNVVTVSSMCSTDLSGNINLGCTFTVPSSTAGSHAVDAYDGANHGLAFFTVVSAITLSPTSGPVGTLVTVSGSGLKASASITVTFDFPIVSTCSTDASGNIKTGCTFTVPSSKAGSHYVGATDGTNGPVTSFTVVPALTLAPMSGPVGTVVTVSGSGFKASASITVTFDMVAVSSMCSTDASGNLKIGCTVTVPSSSAGSHSVQASDGTNSATATFTVTVTTTSVSCTPSSVNKGATTMCTATVSPSTATGNVTWTASTSGTFSANSCTLSSGACSTSFVPSTKTSPVNITASYSGDTNNSPSGGYFLLSVKSAAPEFPVPFYLAIIVAPGLLLSKLLGRRAVAHPRDYPSSSLGPSPTATSENRTQPIRLVLD